MEMVVSIDRVLFKKCNTLEMEAFRGDSVEGTRLGECRTAEAGRSASFLFSLISVSWTGRGRDRAVSSERHTRRRRAEGKKALVRQQLERTGGRPFKIFTGRTSKLSDGSGSFDTALERQEMFVFRSFGSLTSSFTSPYSDTFSYFFYTGPR